MWTSVSVNLCSCVCARQRERERETVAAVKSLEYLGVWVYSKSVCVYWSVYLCKGLRELEECVCVQLIFSGLKMSYSAAEGEGVFNTAFKCSLAFFPVPFGPNIHPFCSSPLFFKVHSQTPTRQHA